MPATRLERVCTPVDGLAVCTSHASTCMNGGEDLVCCAFRFDPLLRVADYALNPSRSEPLIKVGLSLNNLLIDTDCCKQLSSKLVLCVEVSCVEVIETLLTLIRESRDNKTSITNPVLIIPKCIPFGNCTNYISVTIVIVY